MTQYISERGLEDSVMLIVNALFFKSAWRRRYFAPENTRVSKFNINANDSINVPYMHGVGRFYYIESTRLDAKILRIPYDVRGTVVGIIIYGVCRKFRKE